MGEYEKALKAFRRFADLKPDQSSKCWIKMGTVYINLQMGKEAEKCFINANKKDSTYANG